MKKLLILLTLLSCQNEEIMIIPKGIPFEFVMYGKPTYNETKPCGSKNTPWYMPWRCDTPVVLQFQDGVEADYKIRATDECGNKLFVGEADKPLLITQAYPGNADNIFAAYPLSGFTNKATGVGPLWTLGASPSVLLPIGTIGSYALIENVVFPKGAYTFYLNVTNSAVAAVLNFNIKKGTAVIDNVSAVAVAVGAHTIAVSIDLSEWCDNIEIFGFKASGAATTIAIVSIYTDVLDHLAILPSPFIYSLTIVPDDESLCNKMVRFILLEIPEDEDAEEILIARTDLAKFSMRSCILLFEYTRSIDYAGIIYTPYPGFESPIFKMCVEGKFFHADEVEEMVAVETDNETIMTAASIKEQRQLDVEDAPDWFHLKLKYILNHGVGGRVTSDGLNWIREGGYEKEKRNEKYREKPGRVMLTDPTSVQRSYI